MDGNSEENFCSSVFLTIVWLGWVLFNQINASAAKKYEEVFWQPYDKEKVAALTAVRQPVFIDFTAKWCITCLANEKWPAVGRVSEFAQGKKNKHI